MRLLLAVAVLFAMPATATASDRTLERSWSRYQAATDRLDGRSLGGSERAELRVLRLAVRRGGRIVRAARRELAGDAATTLTGGAAREAALDHLRWTAVSLRALKRALPSLERAFRLAERGERRRARTALRVAFRRLRPAARAGDRAERLERQASKLFRAIARAS